MNGWLFRAFACIAIAVVCVAACHGSQVGGSSESASIEAADVGPGAVHFASATEGRFETGELVAFGGCGNGACGVSQGAASGLLGQPIRRAGRAVRFVGRGLGRVLFWRR